MFSFSLLNINAQETKDNDKILIDNFIKSISIVEKEEIVSDTLAKVFSGKFYLAYMAFNVDGGTASCSDYRLVIKDGKLTELEILSSKKKLDILYSFLQDNFQIKNENDAKIFETALDKIYPLGWSEAEAKERMKIDNKWYFIRGKFFDTKKGFIITLDQNSRISQIDYDLEAIKEQ